MAPEQRFFRMRIVFPRLLAVLSFAAALAAQDCPGEDRKSIAEGRLSVVLPDGWVESKLNGGDVAAGWATQDNRTSLFIREMNSGSNESMRELLDLTVANFESRFEISDLAEPKSGEVPGKAEKWPAIFTTLEATFRKSAEEVSEMRFYVFLFDTGERLYLVQASTTKPVRESRERQIYHFLRSIVANR